jgi:DNA-binding transcriptional LysR family regulator
MFKQLQDMALFALVAEMGSFTAAARRRNCQNPALASGLASWSSRWASAC